MKLSSKAWVYLLAATLGGGAIACSSGGGGGGGGGEGGSGDTKTGGKGGGTGKTGGTSGKTGGTGGGKTGGTGGGTTGGTGGGTTGGSGGSTGGTGGAVTGGAGGTKTGGTGGTGTGGTPSAAVGTPIFSGKTMTFEKLVAGDDGPGYTYVTADGTAGTVNVVPVNDPKLPAGVKYALESVNPAIPAFSNVIFGFNFRKDASANKRAWYDAKTAGYTGFRYWAKAAFPAVPALKGAMFNNILYAAGQWPSAPTDPTSMKGTCADPTGVACEPNISLSVVISTAEWREYKIPFADMQSATSINGLDFERVGRVDLLHSSSGAAVTLSVTAIEFYKE